MTNACRIHDMNDVICNIRNDDWSLWDPTHNWRPV